MINKNGIIIGNQFNESLQNFTINGTPTIENGVVSGFSSSNYVSTPVINFSTANTWSIITKFNTGTSWSTVDSGLISGNITQNIQAIINNSGVLRGSFGNGTTWIYIINPIAQLALNTDYILEMGYNGTDYYVKLDGTLIGSYTSNSKVPNTPIRLGRERANAEFFIYGSFDLKQFSLSINDKIIFAPAINTGISNYQITSTEFYEI